MTKMHQKLVSNEGQALCINWFGIKKMKTCGVPNTEKKIRQKLLVSLLLGTPHKLIWHPAGKYLRGANQTKKNCPAGCLTHGKI